MQKRIIMIAIFCFVVTLSIGTLITLTANSVSNDDLDYFPIMKVGTQWYYQVSLPDEKYYRKELAVMEPEGENLKLTVFENETPVADLYFIRNEQGIYKVKENSAGGLINYEPAQLVLSSKLNNGAAWKWESTVNKEKMKVKVSRGGKIKVRAGTFNTILLRAEGTLKNGTSYINETWYAKGVGYVKDVITVNNKKITEELVKYTIGTGKN